MKKILFIGLIILALTLAGCGIRNDNVTFTAVIESVSDHALMVTTTDNVGFDKASVGYDKKLKMDFQPVAGQTVIITIRPEIRESYPVQVTAIKIIPADKKDAAAQTGYKKITPEEARAFIDNEDVIILDVRTQEEYNQGHISNSIIIPDTEIKAKAEEILPDKNAKILVYCRSGRRSALASKNLADMGYTQVYDFGGIIDWPYIVE